jgi:hypothetical protein
VTVTVMGNTNHFRSFKYNKSCTQKYANTCDDRKLEIREGMQNSPRFYTWPSKDNLHCETSNVCTMQKPQDSIIVFTHLQFFLHYIQSIFDYYLYLHTLAAVNLPTYIGLIALKFCVDFQFVNTDVKIHINVIIIKKLKCWLSVH